MTKTKQHSDKKGIQKLMLRAPKIRAPKINVRQVVRSGQKPEIIIGIPTLNEAETISHLIKTLDNGVQKYFNDKRVLIINADANSPDGTRKAFLSTKTKTSKKYIEVPKGKGNGLKVVFEYFLSKETAKALVLVDGDIVSATPRWVRNLATPILKGFDHVFPIFNRHELDASITNHVVYPVMRGILGIDIRQPLAGEVGLSRKAVDRIYNRDWPARADKYGVDTFMTFSSVLAELRIAETYLGVVDHRPGASHLYNVFEDVVTSLFELLDESRGFWSGRLRVRKPPLFFKDSRTTKYPSVKVDYQHIVDVARDDYIKTKKLIKDIVGDALFIKIEKTFKKGEGLYINTEDWVKIMFAFTKAHSVRPLLRAKALRPLYYARFLSFNKDYSGLGYGAAEKGVIEQAHTLYDNRNKFLVGKNRF